MKKSKKDKDFVHKAYYEGGSSALSAFIKKELRYPPKAVEAKIEGIVKLKFEVDYLGETHHIKVISSLGYGCDEEAIRIVDLLQYKVPKSHNIRVGYQKKINIRFKLPKKKVLPQKKKTTYSYTIVPEKPKSKENPSQKSYHYSVKTKK